MALFIFTLSSVKLDYQGKVGKTTAVVRVWKSSDQSGLNGYLGRSFKIWGNLCGWVAGLLGRDFIL